MGWLATANVLNVKIVVYSYDFKPSTVPVASSKGL